MDPPSRQNSRKPSAETYCRIRGFIAPPGGKLIRYKLIADTSAVKPKRNILTT
jgi:hypothetical protein